MIDSSLLQGLAVRLVLLTTALLIGPLANAAWVVDPSAQIRASYEDNIGLDDPEQEGYTSTASIQARLANVTETSSVSMVGNLLYRVYAGVDDVPGRIEPDDKDEQNLALIAQRSFERTFVGVRTAMRRDLLMRRSVFIPGDDTGEFPEEGGVQDAEDLADEAGFTDVNATREQIRRSLVAIDPFIGYQLTERTNLRVGYQHIIMRYDSTGEGFGLQDSDSRAVYTNLTHSLSERDRVNLNLRVSEFEPDAGQDTDTDEVTIGWNRNVSERFRFGIAAGMRRVESAFNDDDGFVVRANAQYRTQLGALSANYSRTATPTAFGDVAETDRFGVSYSRELSDLINFRISATGFKTSRDSGTSGNDREFVTIEPSLRWRLTEELRAGFSYTYRYADRESDMDSHTGNIFSVSLIWQPQSQL